ncbi:hypothetical protein DM02DRAFT_654209 [Periconia macrospinosa]|uniref:Carbohydrate-binding module family 19 domain-containing protein n=1 Tax=Periconia macrospinosa TaxID=97972 RepID=A0A2V1DUG2_9PLEO|nr:hypothetical protein DM02DRAFT_654209 [Periconia macrospinosa]
MQLSLTSLLAVALSATSVTAVLPCKVNGGVTYPDCDGRNIISCRSGVAVVVRTCPVGQKCNWAEGTPVCRNTS